MGEEQKTREDIPSRAKTNNQNERNCIMIKKMISIILTVASVLSFTACGAPTYVSNATQMPPAAEQTAPTPKPTPDFPEYPTESVQLSTIGEYTIIYPAAYDEYRMEEVYILRDAIKNILSFELEVKPDTSEATGKEIIFASSERANGVDDAIKLFQSGMDYVVGTLNGNIILGGNNFYADARAVYDFINNYLCYDDIENIAISEPKTELSGVNLDIYEEPEIVLYACNYSTPLFDKQFAIRDMAEAKFNMVTVISTGYNDTQLLDFLKWCARFEIKAILWGGDEVRGENLYADCPIVWGHCLRDEPTVEQFADYSKACDEYLEKYGYLGWKPFVNFSGFTVNAAPYYGSPYFSSCPVVSIDRYFGDNIFEPQLGYTWGHNSGILEAMEIYANEAANRRQDLWCYIECYNSKNWNLQTQKSLRFNSYVCMSFGAKGILYFQYGDASKLYTAEGDWSYGSLVNWDFTKNEAWYHAKQNNEELLRLAEIYNQYKYRYAYTRNVNRKADLDCVGMSTLGMDKYDEVLTEIDDKKTRYLVGKFSKISGEGEAFTLVNLEPLTEEDYMADEAPNVRLKINGENVKFYFNGELQNIEVDSDGYYTVPMGNGYSYFVTVE